MQATVRAKGHKPSRSGLLMVLLVFAGGLALGALAWNIFEDDDTGSSSQAVVQAPSGGMDGHGEGLRNKYAESVVTGQDTRPAGNVEPGEPNITALDYGIGVSGDAYVRPHDQFRLYNGTASEHIVRAHHVDGAGQGYVGGLTAFEPEVLIARHVEGAGQGYVGGLTEFDPDIVTAHHVEGAGQGYVGGNTEIEADLPTAYFEVGMGQGWIGTGTSVDAGIAQDPVALPGIGYFA